MSEGAFIVSIYVLVLIGVILVGSALFTVAGWLYYRRQGGRLSLIRWVMRL